MVWVLRRFASKWQCGHDVVRLASGHSFVKKGGLLLIRMGVVGRTDGGSYGMVEHIEIEKYVIVMETR